MVPQTEQVNGVNAGSVKLGLFLCPAQWAQLNAVLRKDELTLLRHSVKHACAPNINNVPATQRWCSADNCEMIEQRPQFV